MSAKVGMVGMYNELLGVSGVITHTCALATEPPSTMVRLGKHQDGRHGKKTLTPVQKWLYVGIDMDGSLNIFFTFKFISQIRQIKKSL